MIRVLWALPACMFKGGVQSWLLRESSVWGKCEKSAKTRPGTWVIRR